MTSKRSVSETSRASSMIPGSLPKQETSGKAVQACFNHVETCLDMPILLTKAGPLPECILSCGPSKWKTALVLNSMGGFSCTQRRGHVCFLFRALLVGCHAKQHYNSCSSNQTATQSGFTSEGTFPSRRSHFQISDLRGHTCSMSRMALWCEASSRLRTGTCVRVPGSAKRLKVLCNRDFRGVVVFSSKTYSVQNLLICNNV